MKEKVTTDDLRHFTENDTLDEIYMEGVSSNKQIANLDTLTLVK